jgi:hypothetical protein
MWLNSWRNCPSDKSKTGYSLQKGNPNARSKAFRSRTGSPSERKLFYRRPFRSPLGAPSDSASARRSSWRSFQSGPSACCAMASPKAPNCSCSASVNSRTSGGFSFLAGSTSVKYHSPGVGSSGIPCSKTLERSRARFIS